jgi:curved DNA-binding protein CbpA
MAAVDTFELLPSLAQGELSETGAPELVAAVFRSRASGTLWLETEEGKEIRAFFRAGDMCGSAYFDGFRSLAHVLLENDWVDALDIDSSRTQADASKKRHGEVLVAKGLLTLEQLHGALAEQHRANLATLLGLTAGRYDWRGTEPPPAWAREVVVDPVGALIDAFEQEKHAPRRKRVLQWLGNHAARLSPDWPELQGRVTLGPLDHRAAALLALPRRLRDFVQSSRLSQTRAEALLVALLLAGAAEPQPGDAVEPAAARTKAPRAKAAAAPVPDEMPFAPDAILEPFPEAESQPPEPALDLADALSEPSSPPFDEQEALARLDSLSLDDVVPVAAADEPLEIDLPPRHAAAGTTTGEVSDDRRDLRKKMMARGQRNLGALPSPPRKNIEGAQAVEPAVHDIDKTELSHEDRSLVDEVRSRARLVATQNAYAVLGVSPATPQDGIKSAYLRLAKRFHPDKASDPSLAGLLPELQALFSALKEAWDCVSTPALRAKYDANLKAGPVASKGTSKREEATLALKMGEVLLKKRDFEAALNKLRRSVDLDPNADAMAALAWALVSDPKASEQAKEEAASLINRALRAPGATARTYYVAGVLWRTKDPDSAVDAFRKALEIEPQHSDAALELRLIEQRRGKRQKAGGGVLSGLLFGKRKP